MKVRPIGNSIHARLVPKHERSYAEDREDRHGILFLPENRKTNDWDSGEPLEVEVLATGPKVDDDITTGMRLLLDPYVLEKYDTICDGKEIVFPCLHSRTAKNVSEVFNIKARGYVVCAIS